MANVDAIYNATLEGNIFYYGTVERKVELKGGSYFVTSKGEGNGFMAAVNIISAPAVWFVMDQGIKNMVGAE